MNDEKIRMLKIIKSECETIIDEAEDFDPKVDDDFAERASHCANEIINFADTLINLENVQKTLKKN